MIYQAYKNFGSMTTVTIKNVFLDQNSRTQSGFGFIHFETIEGARAAVNFGSCLHFGGVNYNAEFSKHLMKRGERKTPSYQPAPPPHPIAGPGPGTQSISWMTPPQSPRINAPQFPGNYTPQFPGHYTPQFSGHYTPYPVPSILFLCDFYSCDDRVTLAILSQVLLARAINFPTVLCHGRTRIAVLTRAVDILIPTDLITNSRLVELKSHPVDVTVICPSIVSLENLILCTTSSEQVNE
jgi:hypothetical protein